jgi:uncharacterized protein YndB with AHSA1/START domain
MTTNDNQLKVTVSCDIDADQKAIFNAWLDTSIISKWMFGENVRDEKIIKLENDPREGRIFSYVVQRGDLVLNHTGEYIHIPYTQLVFSWYIEAPDADKSIVSINLTLQNTGCRLTLVHEIHPKWRSLVMVARISDTDCKSSYYVAPGLQIRTNERCVKSGFDSLRSTKSL